MQQDSSCTKERYPPEREASWGIWQVWTIRDSVISPTLCKLHQNPPGNGKEWWTHCGGTVQKWSHHPSLQLSTLFGWPRKWILAVFFCLNASQHKILCSANWIVFPPRPLMGGWEWKVTFDTWCHCPSWAKMARQWHLTFCHAENFVFFYDTLRWHCAKWSHHPSLQLSTLFGWPRKWILAVFFCLNASQHKILCSANWNAFPPPCIARSRCTSCSWLQLHLHQQIDRWSCSSATRRLSSIELPGRTARSGCWCASLDIGGISRTSAGIWFHFGLQVLHRVTEILREYLRAILELADICLNLGDYGFIIYLRPRVGVWFQ